MGSGGAPNSAPRGESKHDARHDKGLDKTRLEACETRQSSSRRQAAMTKTTKARPRPTASNAVFICRTESLPLPDLDLDLRAENSPAPNGEIRPLGSGGDPSERNPAGERHSCLGRAFLFPQPIGNAPTAHL